MKNKIAIINFVKNIPSYIFNSNEKYIKWGVNNDIPFKLLELYESIPEHATAIDFILSNVIENNIEQMGYWELQKIALDYILFGGFTVLKTKLRNGDFKYEYKDISKCRLSGDLKRICYADDWTKYKTEIEWFDLMDNTKTDNIGMFLFKSPKSRYTYPTPRYNAVVKSLDTMSKIINYHNNNASNGFSPNVIINFNDGNYDDDTKAEMAAGIEENFTGSEGKKFILSFNESKATATTIQKLDNDNLDQKFAELQKFIQNQIIVSHQITSPQLIGVKAESQGFSATEFYEAMDLFEKNTISGYRKEIEYGLTILFGTEIILKNDVTKITKEEEVEK